jgi:hypothetical protein
MKWLVRAEVTKAVQARKEEKTRKARQQLQQLESSLLRQNKTVDDVEEEDDDEASLDASLEQVVTLTRLCGLFNPTTSISRPMPPCTFYA